MNEPNYGNNQQRPPQNGGYNQQQRPSQNGDYNQQQGPSQNGGYNQQQRPPQNGGYNQQQRPSQNGYNQNAGYNSYNNNYQNNRAHFEQQRAAAYKSLAEKEKLSFIIWLIIGIFQCMSLFGIIVGAWNIYAAIQSYNFSKLLETRPRGVYARYEGQLTNIIISLVLNLVLGGVIGVVGAIFDYFTRDYVMKNRDFFN